MGSTKRYARQVREQLEDEEVFVVSSSEVRKRVKKTGGMDAPWRKHIKNRFNRDGWEIDEDYYYNPVGLSQKVGRLSDELKSENRPVVSRGIVSQSVADIGFPSGEWGKTIDEVMRDEGWRVDEENGLYYLPATELVTESSLSFYLMDSFSVQTS